MTIMTMRRPSDVEKPSTLGFPSLLSDPTPIPIIKKGGGKKNERPLGETRLAENKDRAGRVRFGRAAATREEDGWIIIDGWKKKTPERRRRGSAW